MIVMMQEGASKKEINNIKQMIIEAGLKPKLLGEEHVTVHAIGKVDFSKLSQERLSAQKGVKEVKLISHPFKIASKDSRNKCNITVSRMIDGEQASITFNGKNVVMMAGPCAVESEEQMENVAKFLSNLGVKILRGGTDKPRTSPYDFQGLGEEGLKIARRITDKYRMLFVTEVLTVNMVELVSEYADIIQIGTRNMQNFRLLESVGKMNKPVLLKRGMSATINEFLLAAEYVLSQQEDPQVILCLRGVRSFDNTYTRNSMDLDALPVLQDLTWLPIVVDPSHATGKRHLVLPMSRMAIPGNCNGFIIETHPRPDQALVDGKQSLDFEHFSELYENLKTQSNLYGKAFS